MTFPVVLPQMANPTAPTELLMETVLTLTWVELDNTCVYVFVFVFVCVCVCVCVCVFHSESKIFGWVVRTMCTPAGGLEQIKFLQHQPSYY